MCAAHSTELRHKDSKQLRKLFHYELSFYIVRKIIVMATRMQVLFCPFTPRITNNPFCCFHEPLRQGMMRVRRAFK